MIYLSRLFLNARSRQAQQDYSRPYELHRTLSRAFGDDPEVWKAARCLFRREETEADDALCVLVQSRVKPEWGRLAVSTDWWLREPQIRAGEIRVPAGTRLNFRLRANPTICQEGRRRPMHRETLQQAWLGRKGDLHGFRLCEAQVVHTEVLNMQTARNQPVTMQSVLFEGILVVTDSERFAEVLETGIGSGKGFGFGLLSVARV